MDLSKIEFKPVLIGVIDDQVRWSILINGIEFSYFQGLGHVKSTREFNKLGVKPEERVILELERSKMEQVYLKSKSVFDRVTRYDMNFIQSLAVYKPKLEDVLNCLFLDSYAHDVSFQDWCSEFGYDSDSIKAKSIYDACLESYFKLQKALKSEYNSTEKYIRALEL